MNIALVFCEIDQLFDKYTAGVFSMFESNPPLGLGAIGTVGTNRGHNVKIFDQQLLNYSNEELVDKVIEYNPEIVGFSCTSLNIENAILCAKEIKMKRNCMTFAGGIHITLCTQKVNEREVFDFLISGEGEEAIENIIKQLEIHEEIVDREIVGLVMKGDQKNSETAVLSSLNQPIINRKIMDIDRYTNRGALLSEQPCYSLFSSRGCPFKCKFCSKPDYFKQYRELAIERVIEEIKYLINELGAKAISFREDNFTVDLDRVKLFCEKMIEEFNGNFFWECESRADMPKEVLELMYRAGCRGIWCGIETIVPKWQEWIDKGLEKDSVIAFYNDCKEIGIKTGALFMFGFPDQTAEEIEEDIAFAISLPTEFSAFQCLAIFPGSPLEEFYKESGLCFSVTEGVSLALTKGKTYEEMILMEENINKRISSARLVDYEK